MTRFYTYPYCVTFRHVLEGLFVRGLVYTAAYLVAHGGFLLDKVLRVDSHLPNPKVVLLSSQFLQHVLDLISVPSCRQLLELRDHVFKLVSFKLKLGLLGFQLVNLLYGLYFVSDFLFFERCEAFFDAFLQI